MTLVTRRVQRPLVAVRPGGSWPPNKEAAAAAEAIGFMWCWNGPGSPRPPGGGGKPGGHTSHSTHGMPGTPYDPTACQVPLIIRGHCVTVFYHLIRHRRARYPLSSRHSDTASRTGTSLSLCPYGRLSLIPLHSGLTVTVLYCTVRCGSVLYCTVPLMWPAPYMLLLFPSPKSEPCWTHGA